jgi:uncharacterized protein YcfJ
MKTLKIILTGMALIAATNFAWADHYDRDYTYAQVVDVQPIYATYQIPESRRVCENNTRGRSYTRHQAGNPGGALLGGILGGIIGNRFGRGHGREATTAAGIFIGSAIGSSARPSGYYSNNGRYGHANRRACYTQREYRTEQRITGYDVSYEYDGRIYQTRMQNHPGDRVKVRVDVEVAEY